MLKEALSPPAQLTAAGQDVRLVPMWLYCLFAFCLAASVVSLVFAFTADTLAECQDVVEFPGARQAHSLLMKTLMFAAGALLAVDSPIKWMLIRSL